MVDEFLMAQEAKLRRYLAARRRQRALRTPAREVIREIFERNDRAERAKAVGSWAAWAIGTAICIASTILVLLYDRASVTQIGPL